MIKEAKIVLIILLFVIILIKIYYTVDKIEKERCYNLPLNQYVEDTRCNKYTFEDYIEENKHE